MVPSSIGFTEVDDSGTVFIAEVVVTDVNTGINDPDDDPPRPCIRLEIRPIQRHEAG